MVAFARKRALENKDKFYTGSPCVKCGNRIRLSSSGQCFECEKLHQERFMARRREGLGLSAQESDALREVIEALDDVCETILLNKQAQNAIKQFIKETDRLLEIKALAEGMAHQLYKCDFTDPYDDPDDSTYWEFVARFHRDIKRLCSLRVPDIYANIETDDEETHPKAEEDKTND